MSINHSQYKQQGSVALIMVVVLATLGIFLLKTLHFYQQRMMIAWVKEQNYLTAFSQAESSLAWGKGVSWKLDNMIGWRCERNLTAQLESCLLKVSSKLFLLAGKGKFDDKKSLITYQWMNKANNQTSELSPVKGGWLDYCPIKNVKICL